MKICYLGWGDHVHLERWANYFAKVGHQVTVISVSKTGRYGPNIHTFSLAIFRRISTRLQRLILRGIINIIRPDIIHVHWAPFAVLLDGLWNGPLVITAWGSDIYGANPASPGYPKLAKALRRATLITADSSDLCSKTEQLAGLPAGQVKKIQWGIDPELFTPSPDSESTAAKKSPSSNVILSPRAFGPLYNLDMIIRALALVKQQISGTELVMKRYKQDPDYTKKLESLIEELGLADAISIVERINYEYMPDFYRSGSVIISVPDTDGTPMSVLEAMACGCVPIVSDLPSLREWIRNGETGFLVNPKNPKEIADAAINVLSDPEFRKAAAEKNRSLVVARAGQKAQMGVMEECYYKLTKTSSV